MTVEVLTFGCRLNTCESATMHGLASAAGLRDAILVNTCAVTAEAERQARKAIRGAHRRDPGAPIIVTGCASELAPAAWAALPGVARVIPNAEKLAPASWGLTAAAAPPVTAFAGRARALLQVQQGCDHRCTFCVIPFGRGPSRSVSAAEVIAAACRLTAQGYCELVLTGVDITSFGADLPDRPTLGELCRDLLAAVPDVARLRLSSLDPAEIDPTLWRLLAEEPRLMPHLHLSLQHGDDLILKRMKRRHSRADALACANRARALRPELALGADLIAGFPTEDESAFARSLSLVEDLGLSFLHVFPYSERPGTPAARMPGVPPPLRRERAARLRAAGAAAAMRLYASRLGRAEQVLFEGGGRGHTEQFAPVRAAADWPPPGSLRRVRVTGAGSAGLLVEAA